MDFCLNNIPPKGLQPHAEEEDDEDGDDCNRDDASGGRHIVGLSVVSEQFAGGEEVEGSEGFADVGTERRHLDSKWCLYYNL